MKIDAQLRPETAQRGKFRRQYFPQVAVAFEDFTEAIIYEYPDLQIGTVALQNVERGCREHAIAQAAQPQDRDPAPPRQTFQYTLHGLFFDLRLIHQHDWDVVANRVDAMALHAL